MLRYIFVAVLLLQGSNSQPTAQETPSNQQQAAGQVSPAPSNNRQVDIGNKADSAGDGQNTKQNSPSNTFQQTQLIQYWILVFTSVITTAAVIFYTIFAALTLRQIRRQADNASEQVGKMQGQLDAMNRQADISDKLLTETSNLVGHNENMVKAMQDQLAAMEWHGDIMEIQAGLFDKQVNAMQGQLAAMQSQEKALRESLDETRKAIRYSEAAYIAVTDTSLVQFGGNKVTICRMFYANTGNTPAYNVRIYGHINLWDRPLIPKDHEKLKDIGPAECSQHIICA